MGRLYPFDWKINAPVVLKTVALKMVAAAYLAKAFDRLAANWANADFIKSHHRAFNTFAVVTHGL